VTVTRQAVTHIRESRWFELMYILQGKPDTHDTYASHASPRMLLIRFLRAIPVRGNLSWSHWQRWTEGSCPNPQHVGWLIYGSIPSSSPSHYHWTSRGKVKHLLPTSYIDLLGSYHQHVVITFNTCLRGATHRSLTNTSGGYNLEGVGFPHHTPRPSKPMVLRFSLVALPGLRLTNFNISL
jgi:hypothetical protein